MDILLVHGELCLVVVMRILRGAVEVIIYAKLMNFQTYYVGVTCFPLQEGWRCIVGCFFLEAKKPW